MKTITSKIAPNPKEAKYWIDLTEDPNGRVKKYYNGSKWVKEETQVSFEQIMEQLTPIIEKLRKELEDIKLSMKHMKPYDDHNMKVAFSDLNKRVTKLEQFIVTE